MMPTAVPRSPQSMEELRARLPAALNRLWDIDELHRASARGEQPDRPGLHPENVFDVQTPSGSWCRMLIAVTYSVKSGKTMLNASIVGGMPITIDVLPEALGILTLFLEPTAPPISMSLRPCGILDCTWDWPFSPADDLRRPS